MDAPKPALPETGRDQTKHSWLAYVGARLAGSPDALLGILFMIAAGAVLTCMQATVRYLSADLHPFQIAFFRNIFGFLVLIPWFVRLGLKPFHTDKFHLHGIRALLNVATMLIFFFALSITPLARVASLGFTGPLFVTVFAIVFLGEIVRARRIIGLGVGFLGALVIIQPGVAPIDLGSVLLLSSSALAACVTILIKIMTRTESTITIIAYSALLVSPLSLVPALFFWQSPNLEQWLWLMFIGVAGTLGQMAMTQALKLADVTVVTPFNFLKLIWAAAIGFVVFAEIPDLWTWIGGFIIFAGSAYIAYRERQLGIAARNQVKSDPSSAL